MAKKETVSQAPTLKKILETIFGSVISHSNSVSNSIENRHPSKHLKTLASLASVEVSLAKHLFPRAQTLPYCVLNKKSIIHSIPFHIFK